MYPGTSGRTHGERNETNPATNAVNIETSIRCQQASRGLSDAPDRTRGSASIAILAYPLDVGTRCFDSTTGSTPSTEGLGKVPERPGSPSPIDDPRRFTQTAPERPRDAFCASRLLLRRLARSPTDAPPPSADRSVATPRATHCASIRTESKSPGGR
jgi:hypothetical protein